METLSGLLTLCEGNPPVTGGFLSQRAGNASFDVFFGVSRKNGWISRRVASDLRRYEAHYDVTVIACLNYVKAWGWHKTQTYLTQRTHGVIITSLLRLNDVATSLRRNNDVIITSCVHWVGSYLVYTLPAWNSQLNHGCFYVIGHRIHSHLLENVRHPRTECSHFSRHLGNVLVSLFIPQL